MTVWPQLSLEFGLGQNCVTPNALARSTIFSTQVFRRHADRPKYNEKTKLVAMGGMVIYQTSGSQLDQGDADVLYELLRRAFLQDHHNKPEVRIQFNRLAILKALGRAPGGKTRQLLDVSIERLYAASFEFCIPQVFTGMSRLLLSVMRREDYKSEGHDYEVLLDVRLAQLFNRGNWTLLRKSPRDRLAADPLARGLHAYYSTHSTPYPTKVSKLKELMGRTGMQESKWRKALQEALVNLQAATQWHRCEIVSAVKKEEDKVSIVKKNPAEDNEKNKQDSSEPSACSEEEALPDDEEEI